METKNTAREIFGSWGGGATCERSQAQAEGAKQPRPQASQDPAQAQDRARAVREMFGL